MKSIHIPVFLVAYTLCCLVGQFSVKSLRLAVFSSQRSHISNRQLQSPSELFMARKIDDEADAMSVPKKSSKRNKNKNSEASSTESVSSTAVESETAPTATITEIATAEEPTENEEFVDIGYSAPQDVETPKAPATQKNLFKESNPFDSDLSRMRVPREDPLKQNTVPPEVVFFGEPRNPPPGEAARDSKYHGTLLYWARHATVAPRTSEERMTYVFPRGRLHPESPKHRLENDKDLTFEKILQAFASRMDDLPDTKAFIDANIDLIPSKLFLRALTAEKLSKQSKNDLEAMDYLKDVRRRYILAHDQVFFPLNLEIQKAETRVMTYLARDELRNFAEKWDEVEMSLHFTTLLAARLTWDRKVRAILDDIKEKVKNTVGYMADGIQNDLMSREFRKPGITSEVYLNASMSIQLNMPELYAKIRPEVQLMHETFFMEDTKEINDFVIKDFCPRIKVSPDLLKEKLKIYEASLAAIQGVDYVTLRVRVQEIYRKICNEQELAMMDQWYFDYKEKGYGFETYEPNEIPKMIQYEQRIRDTGNAFSNFAVDIMKMPTKYTESLNGKRPKGDSVDNWLERDPDHGVEGANSYETRMSEFREAYIAQTELRKVAESRLTQMIRNRMAFQDKVLYGNQFTDRDMYPSYSDDGESRVQEFGGED
jgi:hypothetical protein